jgi:hypothetical protein
VNVCMAACMRQRVAKRSWSSAELFRMLRLAQSLKVVLQCDTSACGLVECHCMVDIAACCIVATDLHTIAVLCTQLQQRIGTSRSTCCMADHSRLADITDMSWYGAVQSSVL